MAGFVEYVIAVPHRYLFRDHYASPTELDEQTEKHKFRVGCREGMMGRTRIVAQYMFRSQGSSLMLSRESFFTAVAPQNSHSEHFKIREHRWGSMERRQQAHSL